MPEAEDDDRSRREATQAALDLEFATRLTRALRESGGRGWRQVRERLVEEEIALEDAAMGTLFRDDPDVEFGVLASRDGRSFTFDFREIEPYPPSDFVGEARLDRWEELTEPRDKRTYGEGIRYALRVLGLNDEVAVAEDETEDP